MSGCRVYLGHLPYRTRERDVEKCFRPFGHIRDIHLKDGFGFIEFDDSRDADDAVYEMNGRDFLGERIIVEHARGSGRRGSSGPPYMPRGRDMGRGAPYRGARPYTSRYGPPVRTDHRLVVENLSSRVSWQDLKDLLRKAGDVTYADAHKSKIGEAVVEFASHDDMLKAIDKYDGYEINGKKIKLIDDSRGRSRSVSRSRSRSRSPRGRSRSRSPRSRSQSRSRSPHSRSRGYKSRSKSRSRSGDRRSRSRSHSDDRKHSRSRSRSHSDDRRRSRSGSRSSDKKRRRSRTRSHSDDRKDSRSRSRSHSGSPDRDNGMDANDRRRSSSGDRDSPPSHYKSGSPSADQEVDQEPMAHDDED